MKYTENFSKSRRRASNGLYIVIACCLLIIGGAAWFAMSNISSKDNNPSNESPSSEYKDKTSSYDDIVPEMGIQSEQVSPTDEKPENVPYTPENTVSETTPQAQAFMMAVEGKIIKKFSNEELQYSATYGDMRLHTGIDIACKEGTSISACANGTVLSIEDSDTMGKTIIIEHPNGITIKYSAVDSIKVKVGDQVNLGDIIAISSTVPSECNDESHIHIEAIKDNKMMSPLEIMGLDN